MTLNRPSFLWLPLVVMTLAVGCSTSGVEGDAGGDADGSDGFAPDADFLPSCELAFDSIVVDQAPCRAWMCFRPQLALAADGESFLLTYSRNIIWWNTDVYAHLLDLSGEALTELAVDLSGRRDPAHFFGTEGPSEPMVAISWDEGWLVVWEDQPTWAGSRIVASSMDSAGATHWEGTNDHLIDPASWVGVEVLAPTRQGLVGIRPEVNTGIEHNNARLPSVVEHEGGAMVAWMAERDDQLPARTIEVGTLDRSGQRLMLDLQVSSSAAEVGSGPSLAYSGREYLVVWEDHRGGRDSGQPGYGEMGPDIWGRFVRSEGIESCTGEECFLSEEFPIAPAPHSSSAPVARWVEDSYFVVWEDNREGAYDVLTVRVSAPASDGEPTIEPPDGMNVTASPSAARRPSLAASEGRVYLLWHRGTSPWEEPARFDLLSMWSPDGGIHWSAPIVVASRAETRPEAGLAASGNSVGVAWVQDPPIDVTPEEGGALRPFDVRFTRLDCP